jgi:PKD repeat protein
MGGLVMRNSKLIASCFIRCGVLALLAAFGLASCGSGGGSEGSSAAGGAGTGGSSSYTITASAGSHGTIAPAGGTTVRQGASQSYTITPDTGYTIATLVVDGGAVAATGNYTFSDVQANHSLSASFVTAPAGNNIVPSLVAARTSGVAPLSVFFDASGTTDAGIARPFHELEYTWSFGDANAGTWTYGAKPGSSRNAATGPVASHVFESPGTYTVSLTVFDGTYTATTNTTITVQDPDVVFAGTNTVCFSTSGNYTGCPTGAAHVQTSDFAAAINTHHNTNRRLLFRRGETFIAASSGAISRTGPGIIGAYGSGSARPIAKIVAGGAFPIIELSSRTTPGIGDWRVMDFEIDGSFVLSSDVSGIGASGGFNQFLALRLNIHDIWRGIAAGPDILDWWNNHGDPGHAIFDQWAVVDSTMNAIPGCNSPGNYNCDWRVYLAARHSTVQGNYLDNQDTGGSHVLRSEYTGKGVFSNNTLARAGDFQLAIKLHARSWGEAGVANPGGVGTYTEQVVIADNKIVGGINPWTISLGPQDTIHDERVRDIIVERNWFTAGSATQLHMHVNSSDTTIRNNICDLSGGRYHTCVSVDRGGIVPAPINVRVLNNTIYSSLSGEFTGVQIGTASATVVRNNLASAPLAADPIMISGSGTGLIQSNNLLNNTPSALFVSATPSVPADFRLKALPNPARDTGLATVPVLSDFFLLLRPQGSSIDIGAVEGP